MSTRMHSHAPWEVPQHKVPPNPHAPTIDRHICYYCKRDHNMYVTVNSVAASQRRIVTVIEEVNNEARNVTYGVCTQCAIRYGIGLPQKDAD